MKKILQEINACQVCASHLPSGCRPVVAATIKSKVAIIGQAPGRIVHASGIPWQDKSGDRLRSWLGVDQEVFYNADNFALIPMGFCYPGTGRSGDLPPRPECAPLWHDRLLRECGELNLILLVGQYAIKYYLQKERKSNLTKTVEAFDDYLPKYFPMPHPSPRNNIWMKKNPWFEIDVLPTLKHKISKLLK